MRSFRLVRERRDDGFVLPALEEDVQLPLLRLPHIEGVQALPVVTHERQSRPGRFNERHILLYRAPLPPSRGVQRGPMSSVALQSMQFAGLTTNRSPSRSYTPAGHMW